MARVPESIRQAAFVAGVLSQPATIPTGTRPRIPLTRPSRAGKSYLGTVGQRGGFVAQVLVQRHAHRTAAGQAAGVGAAPGDEFIAQRARVAAVVSTDSLPWPMASRMEAK